jgi:hypothetical protein
MQNHKGFIAVPVLVIAVVVAGLLAGGSWWYAKQQDEKAANTNIAVVVNENVNSVVATNENANTNTVVNGNTNVTVNGNTNSANSESKTYTSAKLGFSFTYAPTYANKKVLVKETTDTIYVYTEGTKAESGQFVRKFTKDSSSSLKTAIEQKFLQGYSSSDCFVVAPDTYSASKLGSNWDTARISYPSGNVNAENPWAGADKCPKTYTTTNGLSYFVQNQNDQTKFFFFSIGQYTIPADSASVGEKGWEETVSLVDPTADWKTYSNTKIAYTIKMPQSWSPVAEFDGSPLPLEGDKAMVTFSDTTNRTIDMGVRLQACSIVAPYSCAYHSQQDWRSNVNFTAVTDRTFLVNDFDVGRDSTGALYYVRGNSQYFVYVYISAAAEKKVQTILSTFTFTE